MNRFALLIIALAALLVALPLVNADTTLIAGTVTTVCNSTTAPLRINAPGIYNLTNTSGHLPPSGIPCLIVTARNVVVNFHNSVITGDNVANHYAIVVNSSLSNSPALSNVSIQNVAITDFTGTNANAINLAAIAFNGSSWTNPGAVIENVTMRNSSIGVNLTSFTASYVNISNNFFLNLSSAAFYQFNVSSDVNNSWIGANNFTDNNGTNVLGTLLIQNSSNLTVYSNNFLNNRWPMYLGNLTRSNVSNNNVTGVACASSDCAAIELIQGSSAFTAIGHSNNVEYNWLLSTSATGSLGIVGILVNTTNNTLRFNIIDNFSSGVNLTNGYASATNLTHNVIRNIATGVGQAVNISNASTGNVLIFNNTITNVSEAIVVDPGNATYNVSSNVITNVSLREGILFLDAPTANATVIVWNNTVLNVTNVNLGTGIDLLRLNSSGIAPQVIFNRVNNTGKYGIITSANKTNVSSNEVNFTRVYGIVIDQFNNGIPWNVSVLYNTLFSNNFSINVNNGTYPNISLNTINLTLNGSAVYFSNGSVNGTIEANSIYFTNSTWTVSSPIVITLPIGAIDVALSNYTAVNRNLISFTSGGLLHGIFVVQSQFVTLRNNTVLFARNSSIVLQQSNDSTVTGNNATLIAGTGRGYLLDQSHRAFFDTNNFSGTFANLGLSLSEVTNSNFSNMTVTGASGGLSLANSNNTLFSGVNVSGSNLALTLLNFNGTFYNVSINLTNASFADNTYTRAYVVHPVNVSVYAASLSSPFNGSLTTVNATVLNSTSKQLNSSTALNATGSVMFNATAYELFSTGSSAANINHTSHTFSASVSGYNANSNTTVLPTGVFEAVRQISIVLTATTSSGGAGDSGGGGGAPAVNKTAGNDTTAGGAGGETGTGGVTGGKAENVTKATGNATTVGKNETQGAGGKISLDGIEIGQDTFIGLSVIILIILLILAILKMRGMI